MKNRRLKERRLHLGTIRQGTLRPQGSPSAFATGAFCRRPKSQYSMNYASFEIQGVHADDFEMSDKKAKEYLILAEFLIEKLKRHDEMEMC